MHYDKLVRDKIPAIIEASGKKAVTRVLEDGEYRRYLEAKLDEEVAEFHRDKNPEELADILEVVFALAENIGCRWEQLMAVYQRKHDERGGFGERCFLIGKEKA